jgi:K+-transporting ATPase KdpF subunit
MAIRRTCSRRFWTLLEAKLTDLRATSGSSISILDANHLEGVKQSCGHLWHLGAMPGPAGAARCAIFMEFLYPAPLSSLESLCGIRDILESFEHFQAKQGPVRREIALERIFHDELRSRLCLFCHWRGGLCRHGALSERLRQVVRGGTMTFDNLLGAIVTAVIMIYLVIALIRPERF